MAQNVNFVEGASCSNLYNQNQQIQQQNYYQHQQLLPQTLRLNQTVTPDEKLTSEVVREYLRNKENLDCVVMIYHAKVAQKSYGAEKRFFCPPPMVYLRGKGWKVRGLIAQNAPGVSHNITGFNNNFAWSNDETSTNNTDYDYEEPRAFIGIVGAKDQDRHALEWQKDSSGRCAIKALHISENDNNRRKYFTLSVHCFYKSGQLLGKFESKRIKVISKPSKKKNIALSANSHNSSKQSDIKNQGINIASGTEIALFSRVRSQTTNTRYLFVKDGKFVAHSKFWGSFTIHLIDLPEDEHFDPYSDDFAVKDGFINYGSIVKLVDSVTGLALPMMKICKVDKQDLVSERESANEQVSQLHKCAFQMLSNEKLFMCFTNDQIFQQDALSIEKDGRVVFKDGAQWTIISTDTMHYRFYEALGPTPTEISPVPIVNFLEMHASDTVPSIAYVELLGQNFYPNLQVWIGSTPVQTFLVNKELIRFALPSLLALNREEGVDFVIGVRQQSLPTSLEGQDVSSPSSTSAIQRINGECQNDFLFEFPLLLARDDGVIFATQLYVTYYSSKDLTNNFSEGVPRV
uniref:LAG1_DNAbind domain-containing protein n=1 Tax=Meloidogyne hapla TaxID=6305 RepID=A0A1I8AWU5_MELHA